jgi:uncharacterized membrane protein
VSAVLGAANMWVGVLGVILTFTGLHMTLTWPVAPLSPSANIYFGEPVLFFGVLLLAAAFFMWRRCGGAATEEEGVSTHYLIGMMKPVSIVIGIGQLLLPIGIHKYNVKVLRIVGITWIIGGVIWLVFSSMNYYTHVGLIQNTI